MAVVPGDRIGAYEIRALIGAGGMGEVYRAHDTRLHRDVALKVLPDGFAADPDRLARFKREAQLLASLNHSNIAAIHGFEDTGSTHALVLELVDGSTLADRIAQGPLPVDEALPIARQIAEALEAAHEQGIVHRDLKPANIKVRPDGTVKVLDFGLAKAFEPDVAGTGLSRPDTISPTITSPVGTRLGVILGTAAYMSPEQARGKPVDKRADIWAFGCVLYEMLTGRRPFDGDDVSDVLARVIERPIDFTVLPAKTPASIARVIRRCLEKDAKLRMRDIGEARIELDASVWKAEREIAVQTAPRRRYALIGAATVVIAGVAALGMAVGVFLPSDAPGALVKLQLVPPPDSTFGAIAVSPDGRTAVFTAQDSSGRSRLWLRSLESIESQPLQGTEGATYPFWSPDSESIGFFAGNFLKRLDVAGGAPRTICELINARGGARGGTWSREDIILFAGEPFGPEMLYQVSASGGEPRAVPVAVEGHHHWPVFLPDGRRFLFFGGIHSGQFGVYVGSLDSPESRLVIRADTSALFAPASSASGNEGFLLFVRDQTLMAQSVDIDRMELLGPSVPVADQIGIDRALQLSKFSVSNNGVLVYTSGTGVAQLRWFDSTGKPSTTLGPPGINVDLRLSPDGRAVAVQREDGSGGADIWLYDPVRGAGERFTTHVAYDAAPVWAPDGSRLFFFSAREGPWSLYEKASSGSRDETLVLKSTNSLVPLDVSPDGQYLLYVERNIDQTYEDILVLPASGPRSNTAQPRTFIATRGNDNFARFSPDGRWVAYVSDESGRNEVYVRAFNQDGSPGSERYTISTDGGIEPAWPKRSNEIFYIGPDDVLMVVDIQTAPVFKADVPRPLFTMRRTGVVGYDTDANGERFLASTPIEDALSAPATVVLNWFEELKRLERTN